MAQPNTPLTLGSLFDGSGGFPLAGILAGVTPIWASEIEPFAIRVTTKRLPQVRHYGDVSSVSGAELPPVDIITFGSPCQDMSIAGKRSGLDGSRSSLFYEAIRIVKEMRCATNGEKPRFIIWENVPGAFSSNKGADFKAVLESVIGVAEPTAEVPAPDQKGWPDADYYLGDGWSVAYRVLDAQGWGVPQRRKRIYLVADFAGQSAPKVLFESEGVSGYSAAGFRAWQRTASGAESGTGTAGGSGGDVRSAGEIVLNDQGGACMDVSENVTGTLRAQEHGHPPCVMEAAGFCTEHSANARSIGYEEERSPTLRAGVVPAAIALENHPTDSRVKIAEDGMIQTLPARMGTGGGNVPLLMEPESTQDTAEANAPVTLKIRSGCEGGGKGAIWQEDKSATLGCNNDQTLFVPEPKANLEPKAYGICSKASHAMLSDNPHSGFYEAETSRTLDGNGGNPTCAQGGVAICQPVAFTQNQRDEVRDLGDKAGALAAEPGAKQQTYVAQAEPTAFHVNQRNELIDLHGKSGALMATRSDQMQTFVLQGNMIGRSEENGPQGDGINEGVSFTLDATDRHAVCAPTPDTPDDGVYAMTTGSYMQVEKDVSPTLMARDFKDPTSIAPVQQEISYSVRRLTPTECARLQGFPDDWCHDLGTVDPTDEEIAFWTEVFETYRRIVTHAKKPKTEKQIRKWLADPYSDAAEYKLWGNGISLPIPYFVLSGIVWVSGRDTEKQ